MVPEHERTGSRRLFFALWPSDETRRRIIDATGAVVAAASGRAVPPENFHVTLAFVGSVPADRLEAVLNAGATVDAARFTLTLDRIEPWRRSHVLVLNGSGAVPAALELLVARLRISLLQHEFELPDEFYRPHVTLLRRLPPRYRRVDAVSSIQWHVTDFALVDSVTTGQGSRYTLLDRWSLA